MAVTEAELAAILDHCRTLIDAADEFDAVATARSGKATQAKRVWNGPHRRTFNSRYDDEGIDIAGRVRGFRSEADGWALIWADTVNRINADRRSEAVDQISSSRGFEERFGDMFLGDDSGDQIRDFEPVTVPTAENRYKATGGLETF